MDQAQYEELLALQKSNLKLSADILHFLKEAKYANGGSESKPPEDIPQVELNEEGIVVDGRIVKDE